MRRTFWVLALGGLMLGNQAWSQECSVSIDGNDQIQFSKKELRVSKSCKEVTVTLKHVGQLAANVMGHNWVLTATADYQAVATAGQAAGPPNYVPAGDARVLATTTVIGGGQETSVKFDTFEADGRRRLHLFLLVSWPLCVDERQADRRIGARDKRAKPFFNTLGPRRQIVRLMFWGVFEVWWLLQSSSSCSLSAR